MKRDIGNEILAGLDEIAAWRRGQRKLRTFEVAKLMACDVWVIRGGLGFSQESFAGFLGVSIGTVRGWEQGRREPQGHGARIASRGGDAATRRQGRDQGARTGRKDHAIPRGAAAEGEQDGIENFRPSRIGIPSILHCHVMP